jgi:hypothetical protein
MKAKSLAPLGLLMLVAGCVAWPRPAQLPARESLIRDQLIVHTDFDLPKRHRLLDELAAQRGDLTTRLNLPVSDEPIHVYLFETPKHYQAFIQKHHPEFPERRAFFIENDARLAVYAQWGERIAEDLRHEVAHGYLHASVPNLPLWLDEGLAEFFEVPRGQRGLNRPHVGLLLSQLERDNWQPDLARLEQLSDVAGMTQLDYAESWAWVHWMLETAPQRRTVLQNQLLLLRERGTMTPLSLELRKLEPAAERLLVEHLKSLSTEIKSRVAERGATALR